MLSDPDPSARYGQSVNCDQADRLHGLGPSGTHETCVQSDTARRTRSARQMVSVKATKTRGLVLGGALVGAGSRAGRHLVVGCLARPSAPCKLRRCHGSHGPCPSRAIPALSEWRSGPAAARRKGSAGRALRRSGVLAARSALLPWPCTGGND